MILQVLIVMIAGWVNRHQQQVIAYFAPETVERLPPGARGRRQDQGPPS